MDYSVIVPAYNAAQTIEACITALKNQTDLPGPFEIIVVDNGSTDGTGEIAAAAGAQVIIEHQKGAAAARNAGIRHAQGKIVCLTDADCEPLPHWVKAITAPLRKDSETIGAKGVYLTKQQAWAARFVQLEYEDKYDLLPIDQPIDFIDTYSAAYRRETLLQNGGFDENMTYLEDQELSFRLSLRGYRMFFVPEAVVYHLHSDTLLSYFRKKVIIGYWKAQVVRRFPSKGRKDSHTPQVMKVQMGLVLLFCGLFVPLILGQPVLGRIFPSISQFIPWLLLLPLITLLFFAGTTLPFIRKAWNKDRLLAILSPIFLFFRALALGCGYIWGLLFPQNSSNHPPIEPIELGA